MKRIGSRTLAVVAVATFAASGCGPASDSGGADSGVVALQAADDGPGAAHGGKGGEGGHGDVPGKPGRDGSGRGGEKAGDLKACVSRNDDVTNAKLHPAWSGAHKIAALNVLNGAVAKLRLDPAWAEPEQKLNKGFVYGDVDAKTVRVILGVDAARVDMPSFTEWARREAVKQNKAHKIKAGKVHVVIQEACFPASELESVISELEANRDRVGSFQVRTDSRLHADFCQEHYAYGQELERRFAPVFVADRAFCGDLRPL